MGGGCPTPIPIRTPRLTHWVEHAWLTDGLIAWIYRCASARAWPIVFFGGFVGLPGGRHQELRGYQRRTDWRPWSVFPGGPSFLGARTQLLILGWHCCCGEVWRAFSKASTVRADAASVVPLLGQSPRRVYGRLVPDDGVVVPVALVLKVCVWSGGSVAPHWMSRYSVGAAIFVVCAIALARRRPRLCANPSGGALCVEIYDSLTDRVHDRDAAGMVAGVVRGLAGRAYGLYLLSYLSGG
ncbi:MAG: hypothetical protein MRJ92_07965 [Nitrospira sp.]|nr:hypothetical protein [Nitrospira sp.]